MKTHGNGTKRVHTSTNISLVYCIVECGLIFLLSLPFSSHIFAANVSSVINNDTTEIPFKVICHREEFSCHSGGCILNSWHCDGKNDCSDGSDEIGCGTIKPCLENEFRCKSTGHCIPIKHVCDSRNDCDDNSDESDCINNSNGHSKNTTIECYAPNRTCIGRNNSMICLNVLRFCDGTNECLNGTDEGGLCQEDHCFHHSHCKDLCHNIPDGSGYACYCSPGLTLSSDGTTCAADDSPCNYWGTCSDICIEMQKSHKCQCRDEYYLDSDGFTCKNLNPATPYIIYSNRHEIKSVDLNMLSQTKSLLTGLKNTIALDFYHYPGEDMIFWTDVMDDKIYRGFIVHGTLTNIEVVVQIGLATAEGLAVDWIGKNIYWVESNLDQIEVAKLNGSFRCTLVAGQMVSPRAIALDPRYGIMFWTDWDSELPRIESASMSGDGRRIVFHVDSTDGAWPNGLSLDYVAERIYWIDARSDSINTVKYDGTGHHEVLRGHELLTHPFAVTIYENYVYWTDWRTNSVIRANKWNGTDVKVIQRAVTQPFDIKIYHPSRQPSKNVTTQCNVNNGGCSHLCLINVNNTYACKCPHVMKLDMDNKTCLPNEKVLLISRPNEIRGVELEHPYYHTIPPINLPKVISAGQIDFDAKERRIYWADSQLNEVKRSYLTGSNVDTIIDTIIEHPFGFSIDWVSRNLFVTSQDSSSKAKIFVCNLNGEYITEIIREGIYSPRSLVAHPFQGVIIWADHGVEDSEDNAKNNRDAFIAMSLMDGNNIQELVRKSDNRYLDRPSSLAIDFDSTPNRLYWVNVGSATIQWINLETHELMTIWNDAKNTHSPLEPLSLTVYKNIILFSSQIDNSIHSIAKTDGTDQKIIRNQTDDVLALRVYDSSVQNGTNMCYDNNGNCSHLCLPVSKDRRVCKCAIGFHTDPNNETNCVGADEFLMYSCNWGLKGIKGTPNSTDETMLPPISRVLMATAIDYTYDDGFIYWVDNDDGSITRIKRDTTNYQTIVQGVEKIEGVAIDWIANNVYWIDPEYDVIEVARANGTARFGVLSGNMSKPNSIVVHPLQGYLFWSDVGTMSPRIERAFLDGSGRTVITNSSIQMINDLAIDLEMDKIYWCDSHSDTIERMNLDGTDREVIVSGNIIESPIALTIYGSYLYWADTNYLGGAIIRADKDNANVTTIPIQTQMGDHVKDIKMFYKRPTSMNNNCSINNGGCEELCFYMGIDRGHRCQCSHGKISPKDNKTCVPYEAFIMFSRVTEIDSIHINEEENLNSPYQSISNKELMRNVIGLTFDYKAQRIIYSDIQKGSISSCFFNGTDHKVLVQKQGSVEGISYDQKNGKLYWTSNSDASISRLNLLQNDSKVDKIIKLSSDDKPRGIAVDGCGSRIYWTNWNNKHPSIQRLYLNGYDLQSIVTTDIRMPNAITIDHRLQKLYWSDARLDKIERCNLDGTDRSVLLTEVPQHPFGLAVYGDWLYWTDWVAHAVLRTYKFNGTEVTKLRKNVQRPMGIVAIANDAEDCTLNPCLTLNGGCEDVCSINDDGSTVCSCFLGRTLSDDNKTCVTKRENCSHQEYQCGSGVCIPFEMTCDGIYACPDQSDEIINYCATRECPFGFFQCGNNRCILENKRCDGQVHCSDSSDEFNCSCASDQFKCKDGPCIAKQLRCDTDPDCSDASDEIGCARPDCSKHPLFWDPEQKFINCPETTACIHPDWVCDGQNDCWDNSDEKNCKTKSSSESCPANSFKCQTGQCIPIAWKCDRDNDCDDSNKTSSVSSDEANCSYDCQNDQFKCNNSDCIPAIWRCDGHQDCSDGSDETEHCRTRTCPDDWFRCNHTGQCIPSNWVCDGENDCGDSQASDEHPHQGCNVSMCKTNEFKCLNHQCILQSFYCDGDDDCGDKSDEPSTCVFSKCQKDHYECKNKKCIPKTWLCNGISDCLEGEDEASGLCIHNMTTSKCADGKYECENEICIEADLLCDGNDDCGDFSDESKCNVNECESGFVCAQNCKDMPIGYKCSCFDGFEPLDGGRICKDVDECKSKRPCVQQCRNTYGSYACSCESGYYSLDGGITCKANSSIVPAIIFSNRYYIRQVDLHGHDSRLLVRNLTNAVALDFDWAERCFYWSDVTALGSSIKRTCLSNLHSNGQTVEQVLHSATVQSPDGIAVDWIARNLYWCDKGKDTIEVSKLDGKFRKVLVRNGLEEPRAIVLDPYDGFMYWTDWGDQPYIGKAEMDGSNVVILVNESLGWPNALTIDYVTKEIFWADAREDYIAVADANGKNRWIVVSRQSSNKVHHIFALTTFEDYIYWSDWETKSIERCHKYHCTNVTTVTTTAHRPMDLQIYHPFRQLPLMGQNPCEKNGGCDILCLLKADGKNTCACPENYVLEDDKISCKNNCTSSQFVCNTTYNCIPFWWKCDTQDDCGDGSDEPQSCPKFSCSPGQFQCQNSHCIPPSQLCDGIGQCGDDSDEKDCQNHTCLPSQFKCLSNGTINAHCISATTRCDGNVDCPGKEDELNCPEKTCMNNQFKCSNNRCIPQVWQCDGDDDCGDNSDEPASCATRACPVNYFRCNSGRCIPLSWKCDGDFDCSAHEDEPTTCEDETTTCHPTYFKCKNNRCIPGRWYCDFDNDCGDNSDENQCKPRECSEDEFRCTNGRCIRSSWHCNGEYNCEDKSDESNCNVTCSPKEFRCHNSNFCILSQWKCDGDTDCPDNSDEKDCDHSCMPSEFSCHNSQCISALWRCDGEDDCGDNSDEELSLCSAIACPPGRFRCRNNICIPNDKVCNGRDSCGDNSDENEELCSRHKQCNANEFQCKSKHCIDSGNVCDGHDNCGDGTDEENCDENVCHFGVCSQLCFSKKASNYSCGCANGYTKMHGDHVACYAIGDPAVLLVASENGLRKVNPYKSSVQELIDILSNVSKASRIDSFDVMYEPDKVTLFWTSVHTKSVYRFDAPMIDDSRKKREILQSASSSASSHSQPLKIASGLNALKGITVDWIGKNVYWIDGAAITISTLDGQIQRTLINEGLDQPHDIVVDPQSDSLIWTDWGRKPKIERSRLDGSERTIMVERSLQWPTGLAFDFATKRIYWTDPKDSSIESISIDGKHRHVIRSFNKSEEKPYKIEVFEDNIYVTTFHNNAIFKMNKFGRGNLTYLVQGLNKATDVVVVQENKQYRQIDNPCAAKHCGDGALCVAQSRSKAVCLCNNEMSETPVGEGSVVCTPINSPKATKCDLECLNGGTCHFNNNDTQECRCPPGFEGTRCDRYICSGYCKNKGHCYPDLLRSSGNNPGHVPLKCECPPQWTGERCEIPILLCENFCENGGTCLIEYGVPRCKCPFDFNGQKCQHCNSLNCENGGICRKSDNGTVACHCPPGYSSENCHESQCDNYCEHGNCTIIGGVPQCACFPGFRGKRCDDDSCKLNCLNGGECQRSAKKTVCICRSGYQGKRCEQNLCGCRNGGTCIPTKSEQGHDTCLCPPHFMGAFCERFVAKSCEEVTCQNRGFCVNGPDSEPHCKCEAGFTGPFCETEIETKEAKSESEAKGLYNICETFCLNGGSCVLSNGRELAPICTCASGYAGTRCELSIHCKGFCFNGATCVPSLNDDELPACLCTTGFSGLRCETKPEFSRGIYNVQDSEDKNTKWILITVIPLMIILILLFAIFVGVFAYRSRKRNSAFMHRRMEETSGNVEISNPMYGGDDFDDAGATEALSRSFTIEINEKSTNFTNPMYDYQQCAEEEKRNLLKCGNEILPSDTNDQHPLA